MKKRKSLQYYTVTGYSNCFQNEKKKNEKNLKSLHPNECYVRVSIEFSHLYICLS